MVEEIQSIRSTIDDLRDSAEDMERALNAVVDDGNRLMSRVSWLEAENEKLRELIRTVWLAGDFRSFLGVEEIKERMRELGIEV